MANPRCRAGRQRSRVGVWRRHAYGGECKRAPRGGQANRRKCELCAEPGRLPAGDTLGFIVSLFSLIFFSDHLVFHNVFKSHPVKRPLPIFSPLQLFCEICFFWFVGFPSETTP